MGSRPGSDPVHPSERGRNIATVDNCAEAAEGVVAGNCRSQQEATSRATQDGLATAGWALLRYAGNHAQ